MLKIVEEQRQTNRNATEVSMPVEVEVITEVMRDVIGPHLSVEMTEELLVMRRNHIEHDGMVQSIAV